MSSWRQDTGDNDFDSYSPYGATTLDPENELSLLEARVKVEEAEKAKFDSKRACLQEQNKLVKARSDLRREDVRRLKLKRQLNKLLRDILEARTNENDVAERAATALRLAQELALGHYEGEERDAIYQKLIADGHIVACPLCGSVPKLFGSECRCTRCGWSAEVSAVSNLPVPD